MFERYAVVPVSPERPVDTEHSGGPGAPFPPLERRSTKYNYFCIKTCLYGQAGQQYLTVHIYSVELVFRYLCLDRQGG